MTVRETLIDAGVLRPAAGSMLGRYHGTLGPVLRIDDAGRAAAQRDIARGELFHGELANPALAEAWYAARAARRRALR